MYGKSDVKAHTMEGRVIYVADFRDKWTFFDLEGGH